MPPRPRAALAAAALVALAALGACSKPTAPEPPKVAHVRFTRWTGGAFDGTCMGEVVSDGTANAYHAWVSTSLEGRPAVVSFVTPETLAPESTGSFLAQGERVVFWGTLPPQVIEVGWSDTMPARPGGLARR